MSSNLNSNDRQEEYVFRSKIYEDYPEINTTSVNYGDEYLLQDNTVLSPRLSRMRRFNDPRISSSILNENLIKSKDDFALYGTYLRQNSEKKSGNDNDMSPSVQTRTIPRQTSTFKDLPVKTKRRRELTFSDYSQTNKFENIFTEKSQPIYTSQMDMSDNTFFDFIQNQNEVNFESVTPYAQSTKETLPYISSPEYIVPLRKTVNASAPQQISQTDSENKDKEIAQLNQNINHMNKKLSILENNNKKLQDHLNNLLNERKQLLYQIENSEFEEIIEEEEIQKAKPNYVQQENVKRIEYVQETPKSIEVSHINCLQRRNITLDDVPQRMLESFKNDILRHEKEKTEIEKRSLIETLKIQQKKKLQSLEAEYQTHKNEIQHVSIQTYNTTKFNQITSETSFQQIPSPKVKVKSKFLDASPSVGNKHCQYDDNQSRNLLKNHKAKSTWTNVQKSMMEKIIKFVENNDYESLLNTYETIFCKSMTSIGINNSPTCSTKTSNTVSIDTCDAMVQVNIIIETVKLKISQENRSVLAKPLLVQRGCQPENAFRFEIGTMTDQIFCRSQGMMTVEDYVDHRSPQDFDVDYIVNRSKNRSESRKQIISHTSYMSSPTHDFTNKYDRAISPKIVQMSKCIPIETEHVVEVKTLKSEYNPKHKHIDITEEVEQIVEKKTQQVTSVLDNNKIPKKEIPTTIECWETFSHLKDGQVIEETEKYHDRLVSTDIETIKAHLDQQEQNLNNEFSPKFKEEPENPILSSQFKFQNQNITQKISTDGEVQSPLFQNSRPSDNFDFIYEHFNNPTVEKEISSPTNFSNSYSLSNINSNVLSKTGSIETFSKSRNIPIKIDNNKTSLTSHQKVSKLPINIDNNTRELSSITLRNNNLSSKPSSQHVNISKVLESMNVNYSELNMSEKIVQYCIQFSTWLKSLNTITSSTIEHLPSSLMTVNTSLLDWWVDVTVTVSSVQLIKIVKFLIKAFNKNLLKYLIINLDKEGNSCLHYIIGKQLWKSYDVLDSTNLVEPNIFNSEGLTLLMIACPFKITTDNTRNKFRRLASISNVNLQSKMQGQTSIFIAAVYNNSENIQILCTMGADINIRDNNDVTPLMIACSNNHIDAVTTILSWSGVLLNLKNKEGKTALDIATESESVELIEIFKQRKSMKASELSNYSRIVQNSYSNKPYKGTIKF